MKTATIDKKDKARPRLPEWMRRRYRESEEVLDLKKKLRALDLHTVCQSAGCPNIGECFKKPTATFLILGDNCTRRCRFCGVPKGIPLDVDPDEPRRIAEAVAILQLKHVVITSVTRDDLEDGGAGQFARTVEQIHMRFPEATIETLIPDFEGNVDALRVVLKSGIDILNHNLETVRSLYDTVRIGADYDRSLTLIRHIKQMSPGLVAKSGLMVGLGETREALYELFEDLSSAGCDALTIGQYLPPNADSIPVKSFVSPSAFKILAEQARNAGIRWVSAGPYVRSSYNAEALMRKVKENDGE